MPGASTYLANATLGATLRKETFPQLGSVYLSLHSADPTDDGSETEISGGGYARTLLPMFSETQKIGGVDTVSNLAQIDCPEATADWLNMVTHWGIWTAQVNGKLLYSNSVDTPQTVKKGNQVCFKTGALSIGID